MISYKDNMDVFILAKVMEMNEKEKENLVFELIYHIFSSVKNTILKD